MSETHQVEALEIWNCPPKADRPVVTEPADMADVRLSRVPSTTQYVRETFRASDRATSCPFLVHGQALAAHIPGLPNSSSAPLRISPAEHPASPATMAHLDPFTPMPQNWAVTTPRPGVWVLNLQNPPENRLLRQVLIELGGHLDAIEEAWRATKGEDGKMGPGAMILTSDTPKFFCNGLDPSGLGPTSTFPRGTVLLRSTLR